MLICSLLLLPVLLLEGPLPAGDSGWTLERFETSEAIGESQVLRVRNLSGEIRARRASDDRVQIVSNVQQQEADALVPDLRIERRAQALEIEVRFLPPAGVEPSAAQLELKRRADLSVLVPAGIRLVAETGSDLLEAKGLRSDVEATTLSGEVRLTTHGSAWVKTDRGHVSAFLLGTDWSTPPSFESRTGDLAVWLSPAASAEVSIATGGEITTDFSLTIVRPDGGQRKTATALLGKGGRVVRIASLIGAVKILRLVE